MDWVTRINHQKLRQRDLGRREDLGSRIYLDVPFDQKSRAKQLGCRWDPVRRQWFTYPEIALRHRDALARWMPGAAQAPRSTTQRDFCVNCNGPLPNPFDLRCGHCA